MHCICVLNIRRRAKGKVNDRTVPWCWTVISAATVVGDEMGKPPGTPPSRPRQACCTTCPCLGFLVGFEYYGQGPPWWKNKSGKGAGLAGLATAAAMMATMAAPSNAKNTICHCPGTLTLFLPTNTTLLCTALVWCITKKSWFQKLSRPRHHPPILHPPLMPLVPLLTTRTNRLPMRCNRRNPISWQTCITRCGRAWCNIETPWRW